ncbi:MAG: endonuclease domain-containing protein [Methylothermaceae bacterium]|nr:endonuclease domain-containing protein [Methylothermaceae bacterium]
MHQHAKNLRKNATDVERPLWYYLRGRRLDGLKFRRQEPIAGYIVDFVCHERRLIIELDGGQHTWQTDYDRRRTDCLRAEGYTVLRFWNHEVLKDMETVLEGVRNAAISN